MSLLIAGILARTCMHVMRVGRPELRPRGTAAEPLRFSVAHWDVGFPHDRGASSKVVYAVLIAWPLRSFSGSRNLDSVVSVIDQGDILAQL